jgi:hypothetical protein
MVLSENLTEHMLEPRSELLGSLRISLIERLSHILKIRDLSAEFLPHQLTQSKRYGPRCKIDSGGNVFRGHWTIMS